MSGIFNQPSCDINWASPVQNLAELRSITAIEREDKQTRYCEDENADFHYDVQGTGADDGSTIIRPNDVAPADPGRWYKGAATASPHNLLPGLQGGSLAERYHLAQAQESGLTSGGATTLHKHSHNILDDKGINTHPAIDSHIGSTFNPHFVTKAQVGLSAVTNDAQLKRAAGDFASFASKASPISADILLIEDSADAGNKKRATLGSFTSTGADDTWAGASSGQLPLLLEVDFHFPVDAMGSKGLTVK